MKHFKLLYEDGLRIKKVPYCSCEKTRKMLKYELKIKGIIIEEMMLDTLYRYYKEGYLTKAEWEDYKKAVLLKPASGGESAIKK